MALIIECVHLLTLTYNSVNKLLLNLRVKINLPREKGEREREIEKEKLKVRDEKNFRSRCKAIESKKKITGIM